MERRTISAQGRDSAIARAGRYRGEAIRASREMTELLERIEESLDGGLSKAEQMRAAARERYRIIACSLESAKRETLRHREEFHRVVLGLHL